MLSKLLDIGLAEERVESTATDLQVLGVVCQGEVECKSTAGRVIASLWISLKNERADGNRGLTPRSASAYEGFKPEDSA